MWQGFIATGHAADVTQTFKWRIVKDELTRLLNGSFGPECIEKEPKKPVW